MTKLYFFGSDQYSDTVLTYLRDHSDFSITHFSDLKSFTNGGMVQWSNDAIPIGLCASFPHLFPSELISVFDGRLYNLHPSLLPQYRNVAPVPYAIALGDTQTGITLQRIDEKIDHGEIIAHIKEPILPGDTTPTLLHRLFAMGAELFLNYLDNSSPTPNYELPSTPLVFTRKLNSQSGFVEWPVMLKLIDNQPLTPEDTANPLIDLRLTHHPERQHNILPDLIRALSGYEKVWTTAPTSKGDLRISFVYTPGGEIRVLIPGKPRPITWADFQKYYL